MHTVRIGGFQPLSLIDFPGLTSAVVFTQGCPWRCFYCHNSELVYPSRFAAPIPVATIVQRIELRKHLIDGVVVSGGEPTMHAGLPELLSTFRLMGLRTKLDTNGMFPGRLKTILEAGLVDFVAMDIKTRRVHYQAATGVGGTESAVDTSIGLILRSGVDHEFRTTLIDGFHQPSDVTAMHARVSGCQRFVLQKGELHNGSRLPDSSLRHDPLPPLGELREYFTPPNANVAIRSN